MKFVRKGEWKTE